MLLLSIASVVNTFSANAYRLIVDEKLYIATSARSSHLKMEPDNVTPQNFSTQGINETPPNRSSSRISAQVHNFSERASLAEASHQAVASRVVEPKKGWPDPPSVHMAGVTIDSFFTAATKRFGTVLEMSSPPMVTKILQDYQLLQGNLLNETIKSDLMKAESFQSLKTQVKEALINNRKAFAPVISMMKMAVTEHWFERKTTVGCTWCRTPAAPSSKPGNFDILKCLSPKVLKDGDDLAHCYAAEFANGLEVMQQLNLALLDNDFAQNMWLHYSEVLAKKFQDQGMKKMTAKVWREMPALQLYRNVQETLYRRCNENFTASQFKAMKLVSVMMPFETFHFMRQQAAAGKELFQKLDIMEPRWRLFYEEVLRNHAGQSDWETLQVNIQEASLGDILARLGNDQAANVLIEFLRQHGKTVHMDWNTSLNIASANFTEEFVGLYTIWNHLFLMSQEVRPMAAAILYFPLILKDVETWIHFRTYSLWMTIHEAVLTQAVQTFTFPKEILQHIATISTGYAESMREEFELKREFEKTPWTKVPGKLLDCMSFFFRTFDPEDPDANANDMVYRQGNKFYDQWKKKNKGKPMDATPLASLLALGDNISINISTIEAMMTTCGEFFR